MLPVVEFALNNSVHASTGYTPFDVNGLTHTRVPLTLPRGGSGLGRVEVADRLADVSPASVKRQVGEFLLTQLNVLRHVRDVKIDKKQMLMIKAEVVLIVMRSVTKYYLMLRTYLQI